MCNKPARDKAFRARAYFRKNNLPRDKAQWFTGWALPCSCGQKMLFAPDAAPGRIEEVKEAAPDEIPGQDNRS